MLVFTRANLALFAVPKTGTTAYHAALAPHAQIVMAGDPGLKHMTLRRYDRFLAPFLKTAHGLDPERAAVIREPVEQIRSWYRFRTRPQLRGGPRDVSGMSFDDFVADVIAPNPPEHARIGSQFRFLTAPEGALRVDHLFAHERLEVFDAFLAERLGERIAVSRQNVSPRIEAPLSDAVAAALRAARAEEFALHDAVLAAGGHLVTGVARRG